MKFKIKFFSWIFLFLVACNFDANNISNSETTTSVLRSKSDSVSYSLGVIVAKQMKQYGIKNIKYELFVEGLQSNMQDKSLKIDEELAKTLVNRHILKTFSRKVQTNTQQEKQYESEYSQSQSVVKLSNGIKYKILKKGKGKTPNANSIVLVHFKGKLLDGTEFSNTYGQQPAKFTVKNSIKGWQEILVLMQEGDIWEVYLPPALAFGSNGTSKVPPNATVIYTLELLKVQN